MDIHMRIIIGSGNMSQYKGTWIVSEPYITHYKFKPEDVQPYYDSYDDGSIVVYIKIKKFFGLFAYDCAVNSDDIYYIETEIPERRECGR